MSMTIAPSGAAPIGAAPTMTPPPGAPPGVPVPTAGTVPAILQPTPGVSGGGPSADLQGALEALWGALGALKGAIASLQQLNQPPVAGGGPGGCTCACHQAQAGAATGAMGATTPAASSKKQRGGANASPTAAPAQSSDWKAAKGTKITHPLPGARESSHFGEVSSIREGRPHSGLDLAKPEGTPILAAAKGKVVATGFEPKGLGNFVVIDHGNGFVTKYGHMVEKPSVKKDDVVEAGKQIGKVGNTGNSFGNHLHFMVVKGDKNQDPKPYVDGKLTLG